MPVVPTTSPFSSITLNGVPAKFSPLFAVTLALVITIRSSCPSVALLRLVNLFWEPPLPIPTPYCPPVAVTTALPQIRIFPLRPPAYFPSAATVVPPPPIPAPYPQPVAVTVPPLISTSQPLPEDQFEPFAPPIPAPFPLSTFAVTIP